MKEYLPIGSVVRLKGGVKNVMIYGRKQTTGLGSECDYLACLYPEGNLNEDYTYLFNHDKIEEIVFRGYSGPEEMEWQKRAAEAAKRG
ncbi:MAG: DUF4176 domain-containing protein [Clostridiales bacterium]|nr:DUF4176 domain-containing protein [Clostridiales bacterium]MDR2751996.1 DUF4176 domain-containing protein [Clostridiales bacterium]